MPNQLTQHGPRYPSPHGRSHQDVGSDEIDATGLTGRCDFVDRGDPSTNDFDETHLNVMGVFTDLDLSPIIPKGTKAILVHISITHSLAGVALGLRKKGNINWYSVSWIITQVANVNNIYDIIIIPDSNRYIQYYISLAPLNHINFRVGGWWI